MLREFEILFWIALNQRKDIEKLVLEFKAEKSAENLTVQAIRSRLMMTAFYTKTKLSSERTEQAVNAFFGQYFDYFIGKHTDWLLLNEPDVSQLTPAVLNGINKMLMKTYQTKLRRQFEGKHAEFIDLNSIVANISAEPKDMLFKHKGRKRGRKRRPEKVEEEKDSGSVEKVKKAPTATYEEQV